MSVQVRNDQNTVPFIRWSGPSAVEQTAIIAQDATRTAALEPFTVMGKKKVEATSITADSGNTGDGTFTALALAPGVLPQVGSWNLECTAAIVEGGVFKLEDPSGNIVASNLRLNTGAGNATVFVEAGMTFTITDGATDFAVGDKAAIVISAASGYLPLDPSPEDGLSMFAGIYLGPQIAAATIVAGATNDNQMLVGDSYIDEDQLVFENSITLSTILPSGLTLREEMAQLGIRPQSTYNGTRIENT